MNNSMLDFRSSIASNIGGGKITKIHAKNISNAHNNVSSKRKYFIPNSSREFGKEINIQNNLTVCNNQENLSKRTLNIPNEQKFHNKKKEKQELSSRLKNLAMLKKKKKGVSNSLPHKSNSVTSTNNSNKINQKKLNNKNFSQKNIFKENKNININEDVIMTDNNVVNLITKSNFDEDIEMQPIEKLNIISKKNIQEVDEYFPEICNEIFANEEKYLVNPNYMSNQSDINSRMRAILIDWLIDVHLKYKLLPQTMYIAVNLIDRYLEKNETNRIKLQLVGITAMFIACKYEEIYPPEIKDFVYITDGAYVKNDVLHMEIKMLKSLGFNVTFPTQWSILEIYKKRLNLDNKTFKLAWFLMELCLIDYKSLKFKMSYMAASALLIAAKSTGIYSKDWFLNGVGICEKELENCCREIKDFYVYNSTHNLQAIRKKFSSGKYDEVAKIKLCQ